MQLLSEKLLLPLPILLVIALILTCIILAWAIHTGRKKADNILKVKYQWDPWNQVWYYMITIKEGDTEIPGVELSDNKEGSGYVQVYSFRDYSLRGAIDHFRRKSTHNRMVESLNQITR